MATASATLPRQLAQAILVRTWSEAAYAKHALGAALTRHALAPPDRALTTELVYGTLRHQAQLDLRLADFLSKPVQSLPPPVRAALRLGAYQLLYTRVPGHSAVDQSVTLVARRYGRLRALVNAVLRRLAAAVTAEPASGAMLAAPDSSAGSASVDLGGTPATANAADNLGAAARQSGLPLWLLEDVAAQRDVGSALTWAESHAEMAPICLRVNLRRASRTEVQAALAAVGVVAVPAPDPWRESLLLRRAGDVRQLPGFACGNWSVQDLAATAVGYLVAPLDGGLVLDVCAAPGGKAAHLAERPGAPTRVLAVELHPHRARLIEAGCRRLGLATVTTHVADGRELSQLQAVLATAQRQAAERVLVDAPCSGLGILRRHRERLLRVRQPVAADALCTLQRQLLATAAACVADGGELTYAVCSPVHAEGAGQRDAFLAARPDFELVPLPAMLSPFAAVGGGLQLWSDRDGCDSFFGFVARRVGSGRCRG